MSGPGRNDPCPCGSGQKYKKCCLQREAAAGMADAYTRAERDRVRDAIGRFVTRPEFSGELGQAHDGFFAPLEAAPVDDAGDLHAGGVPHFEEWLFWDHPLRDGRTAADLFLEREGARLRPGERDFLERMRQAPLRPYEVAAVRPEEGLDLFDLWTKRRLRVRERAATRQLAAWDVLVARVVPGGEEEALIEGNAYVFPQDARERLLKDLRAAYRKARGAKGDITVDEFFHSMGAAFYRWWLTRVVLRPLPRVITREGDEMVLARVVFDVVDRDAVRAALAASPALVRQDDGSYGWLEGDASEELRRSLGTVKLTGARLVLEAMSRPRAERGRAMIEALAGAAAAYRATRFEGMNQAMARLRERPSRPASADIPPEIQAEVVGRFYEQHYRTWPDEPLPALDGRTPREAATDKRLRPKLISLLKGFEGMAERQRRDGVPAYDFGWMWGELGLPRPG